MTPTDNKSKFLAKLDAPAKPVLTQVVPVTDAPTKKALTPDELDHFNVYLDKAKGKALRLLKVESGMTIQSMIDEAITEYLSSRAKV